MIAKIGTIIQTDFGTGPIVAITKAWVIQAVEDDEFALLIVANWIGIPADVSKPDVNPMTTLDVSEE